MNCLFQEYCKCISSCNQVVYYFKKIHLIIFILKKAFQDLENKLSKDIEKQKENNQELEKLFDVTMQDIDTRYKGLIVSITEIRELVNKNHDEQVDRLQELTDLYQNLSDKIKSVLDSHSQAELKHQTILKQLEKTQQHIISQDKNNKLMIDNLKNELNDDLNNRLSILEEDNKQLKKSNNKLRQELDDMQQAQDEQANSASLFSKIAIGLAILAMIISFVR